MTHNSVWQYQFNVAMVTNCVLTVQFEYLYYCNFAEIHCIDYCLKMFTKDLAEFKNTVESP